AYAARRLPTLDQLRYRIDRHAEQIREHLAAGDEVGVIAFLRGEVESLFEHLATFGDAARDRIAAYRAALDRRLLAVSRPPPRLQESLTRIGDTLSPHLH